MIRNYLSNCSLNSDSEEEAANGEHHSGQPPSPRKLSKSSKMATLNSDSSEAGDASGEDEEESCEWEPQDWIDGTSDLDPVSIKWIDEDDWRTRNSVVYLPGRITPGLLSAAFLRRSSSNDVSRHRVRHVQGVKRRKVLEGSIRDAAGASSTSDERAKTTGALRLPPVDKTGALWRASSVERKLLKLDGPQRDSVMSTSTSSGELVSNKESQLGMELGGRVNFGKVMYSNLTDELLSNSENNQVFGAYVVRDIDRFDDTLAITEAGLSCEELRRSPVAPDVTLGVDLHADERVTNSDDDREALIADGSASRQHGAFTGVKTMSDSGNMSSMNVFMTGPKHSFYSEDPLALGPDCPSEFDSDLDMAGNADDVEAAKSYYDRFFEEDKKASSAVNNNGMGFDAYEDDRTDSGLRRRDEGFEKSLREVDAFVRDAVSHDVKAAAMDSDIGAFSDQEDPVDKLHMASLISDKDEESLDYPVHGHHVCKRGPVPALDPSTSQLPHTDGSKSMDLAENDREASGSAILSVAASEVEMKSLTLQEMDSLLTNVKIAKERAEMRLGKSSSLVNPRQHECNAMTKKAPVVSLHCDFPVHKSDQVQKIENDNTSMTSESTAKKVESFRFPLEGVKVVESDMAIAVLKLDELDQLLRAVGKAAAALEKTDSIPDAVRKLNEKFDALASEIEFLPKDTREACTAMSVSCLEPPKTKIALVKETSAGPASIMSLSSADDKVELKETGTDVKTVEKADVGVMKGRSMVNIESAATAEPAQGDETRLPSAEMPGSSSTGGSEWSTIASLPPTNDDLTLPSEVLTSQKTVAAGRTALLSSAISPQSQERATSPRSAGRATNQESPAEPSPSKADRKPVIQCQDDGKEETADAVGALREAVANLKSIEKQTTEFLEQAYKQLADAAAAMPSASVPGTPSAGHYQHPRPGMTTWGQNSAALNRASVNGMVHQCRGSTPHSAQFSYFQQDPMESNLKATASDAGLFPPRNCSSHEHRVRFNQPAHEFHDLWSGELSPISNSRLVPLKRVKRGQHAVGAGTFRLNNQNARSNPYVDPADGVVENEHSAAREDDPFPLNDGRNVETIALPPRKIPVGLGRSASSGFPARDATDNQAGSILRSSVRNQRTDRFPLEEGVNVKIGSSFQHNRVRPLRLTLRTRGAGADSASAQQQPQRDGIQGPSLISPDSVSPQKSARSSPTKSKYEAVLDRSRKMYDVHYKRGVRFLKDHEKQMAAVGAGKVGQEDEEALLVEGTLNDDMGYAYNAQRSSFFDPENMFETGSRKPVRTSAQSPAVNPGFYSNRSRGRLGSADSALHMRLANRDSYDTFVSSLKSPSKSIKSPGITKRKLSAKPSRLSAASAHNRRSSVRPAAAVNRRRRGWLSRIGSMLESDDGSRYARTLAISALTIPLLFVAVQEIGRLSSKISASPTNVSAADAAGQAISWAAATTPQNFVPINR